MKKIIRKLFAPIALLSLALGVTISINNHHEIGANAASHTMVFDSAGQYKSNIADGEIAAERYTLSNTGSATLSVKFNKNNSGTTSIFNNSGGEIRLYGGSGNGGQLTFTITGGLFTGVTVNTSRNTGLSVNGGPSITTATVSETFTATDTLTLRNVASGTNQVRMTDITMTYEEGEVVIPEFGNLDKIELDTSSPALKLQYYVGETFSSEGLVVTAFDDSDPVLKETVTDFTTNFDDHIFTLDDVGEVPVEVSYTRDGITKTANYIINVLAIADLAKYAKVSSVDQLYIGATYIIAGSKDNETYAMSTVQNSNNRGAFKATLQDETVVDHEEIQKFELVKGSVENSFGFKTINGTANQYIYAAGGTSSNRLRTSATLDGNASWRITFEGKTTIAAQGSSTRNYLRFNDGNNPPIFSAYASSSSVTNLPNLYVDLTTIGDSSYSKAYSLAYDINVELGLGAEGSCENILNSITAKFDNLSSDAKNIFNTSLDAEFVSARARIEYLTSWVSANSGSGSNRVNKLGNSDNLYAVVTIGAMGLTSILGYYFINKKKKFN